MDERILAAEAAEAMLASRNLADFTRAAWHVIEPAAGYRDERMNRQYPLWNWHLDAICEHLEAVTRGEIRNLLITVPPRTMKSITVSICWPSWIWTREPSKKFLFASHAYSLANRDALKMLQLVENPWYAKYFRSGENSWKISARVAGAHRFENTRLGSRLSTSVTGSVIGEGGDFLVGDDLHQISQIESVTERERVLRFWDESFATRLNDPRVGARVLVMQRCHDRDLAGHVLEVEPELWCHLDLPMEFEPDRKCLVSMTGFEDPRHEIGELLWPERFPEQTVREIERRIGPYAYAGQYQQRPSPRHGGLFKVDRFIILDAMPRAHDAPDARLNPASRADPPVASWRSWDKAATQDKLNARTAGVLMHKLKSGLFVISDVVKGHWTVAERERVIRQTAEVDGRHIRILVEQEPGSGGLESAQATIRNLSGFLATAETAGHAKVIRAEQYAVQVEVGNVALVRGDWNRDFIEEHRMFPMGAYADQVDAGSGAFNKLNATKPRATFSDLL